MVVVTKTHVQSFTMSLKPLQILIYIYIFVFSKKIAYSFPLNHSLPFFPYTRLVPSTFPASGVRQLYDTAVAPIVDAVSKGYNGAVIAYGQTGSGKTYSNLGPSWWL